MHGRLGLSRHPMSTAARATACPSTATATHRYRAAACLCRAISHQIRAKHPAATILGAEPASSRPLRRWQWEGRENLRTTAVRVQGVARVAEAEATRGQLPTDSQIEEKGYNVILNFF
jgi:hypothetical protein|uniref:Uncharacterized protein n=1 Tax=Zea mays TaxID=4577 RepID=A0A804PME0_MAIZE